MAVPRPVTDWSHTPPEQLEKSIVRTRENLERHFGMLKDRFAPKARLRRIAMPFAMVVAGLAAGALAWKLTGKPRSSHAPKATLTRLKLRSAGIADHIRALRLLTGLIRKGRPGIFIVEPGRK